MSLQLLLAIKGYIMLLAKQKIQAEAWEFIYQRFEQPKQCGFKDVEAIIQQAIKDVNKKLHNLYKD